jgi:two-component system, NtrC family, sensor histidine kinase HydH
MANETLFQELKRYVGWTEADEQALQSLHPYAQPRFEAIANLFYARILENEGARAVLEGGESKVGQLKITLKAWMDKLLRGPWDEEYFLLRCRIGRVHVRIAMPQHYMFGAMNVLRQQLNHVVDEGFGHSPDERAGVRVALGRILDLELAIMLHTYREDLEAQQARSERLATFGQLIGSIGHELRNPLGVIESSLYILSNRIGPDERAKKHVERIKEQLGVANDIISALLDMIRDRPLQRAPVQLRELVESVLRSLPSPPASVTPASVSVEGFETLPAVQGDAAQLRQVLSNLIENAFHAAGAAGEVRLSARTEGGHAIVTVEDSGPGVDPDTRRRLFEPLITTKTKGIGLGLALVKRIVERHRGDVAYAPREGHGARFVVRLPLEGA